MTNGRSYGRTLLRCTASQGCLNACFVRRSTALPITGIWSLDTISSMQVCLLRSVANPIASIQRRSNDVAVPVKYLLCKRSLYSSRNTAALTFEQVFVDNHGSCGGWWACVSGCLSQTLGRVDKWSCDHSCKN